VLPVTASQVPAALAEACAAVSAATEADAVAGVVPSWVARPASTLELSAVMAAAAGLNLASVPRGTGTKLAWGRPPDRCDLVVDMLGLDQVLEHEAGDLVARVQAGIRISELAAVLGRAGQELALDVPSQAASGDGASGGGNGGGRGTVGGVLATGLAGPRRLRFGTPRDLTIGITMVRADGQIAHSGGKVVKNVAGYDLGKLLAGSYGTLGVIAEAAFRLHPVPAAAAWVTATAGGPGDSAAAAQRLMATAADSPLAPSAAELDQAGRGQPVRAAVLLEGDPDGVAGRAGQLRGLLAGAGGTDVAVAGDPPDWWGLAGVAGQDQTLIRIAFWAGELAEVARAVDDAAAAAGLDPALGGSAAAGVLHARLPATAEPAAVAGFVTALRAARPLAGTGEAPPARGSAVVLHAPPAVRAAVDVWGPVPSAPLMRAVKDQFDPARRLSPGRFAAGI
jgi:glycolate dehydrogenase FAD-binding subunit